MKTAIKFPALLFAITLLSVCILLFALPASAETVASGECGDNLTYTLDSEGTLRIDGTGDMWNWDGWYTNPAPWNDYGNTVQNIVIGNRVTSIGDYAFSFPLLKELAIPDSVKRIGKYAINCYRLSELVIPDSVTTIDDSAFSYCSYLSELILPARVTTLGEAVFEGCSSFTDLYCRASAQPSGWHENWRGGMDITIHWGWTPESPEPILPRVMLHSTAGISFLVGNEYDQPLLTMEDNGFTHTITYTANLYDPAVGHYTYQQFDSWNGLQFRQDGRITGTPISEDSASLESIEIHWQNGSVEKYYTYDFYMCRMIAAAEQSRIELPQVFSDLPIEKEFTVKAGSEIWYRFTAPSASCYLQDLTNLVEEDYGEIVYEPSGVSNTLYDENGISMGSIWKGGAPVPNTTLNIGKTYYLKITGKEEDFACFFGIQKIHLYTNSEQSEDSYTPSYVITPKEQNVWCYFDGIDSSTTRWDVYTVSYQRTKEYTLPEWGYYYHWLDSYFVAPYQIMYDNFQLSVENTQMVYQVLESIQYNDLPENIASYGGVGELLMTDGELISSGHFYAHYIVPSTADRVESISFDIYVPTGKTFTYQNGAFYDTTARKCGDDLTWTFDKASGTLAITGSGAMYDYRYDSSETIVTPWSDWKEKIQKVILPASIERIGDYAFWGCTNLESVVLPAGLREIGWGAFEGCSALTAVTIPGSVTKIDGRAFDFCTSLTDLYCEAAEQPAGWNAEFWLEGCDATVHWGYQPAVVPGDINGDKVLSIMDVTALLQALSKYTGNSFEPLYDVNTDNTFSIMDVTKLLQMLAKAA